MIGMTVNIGLSKNWFTVVNTVYSFTFHLYILKHGVTPSSFCISTIIPTQIIEVLLLVVYSDHCIIRDQLFALKTDDLQFAYKANTSTVQCVSMVQETISYLINNGSHVVMCMLDASQAFNRVNLLTLLKKLHCKGMCPVYLKTLIQLSEHNP